MFYAKKLGFAKKYFPKQYNFTKLFTTFVLSINQNNDNMNTYPRTFNFEFKSEVEDKNDDSRTVEVRYKYESDYDYVSITAITDTETGEELDYFKHFTKFGRQHIDRELNEHLAEQATTPRAIQQMWDEEEYNR